MQKEILLEMLDVNHYNCSFTFKDITTENVNYRLNEKTASVGFIYRHIGEVTNTLGQFLGFETDVKDTTLGQTDTGKEYDLKTSQMFFQEGYDKIHEVIKNSADEDWLKIIDAPFFGLITKMKLLSIILFHNSHHCGQIASAVVKGRNYQKEIVN